MGNKVSKAIGRKRASKAVEQDAVAKGTEGIQENKLTQGLDVKEITGVEATDLAIYGDLHINVSHTTVQHRGDPVSSFRIVDAPIDIFEGRKELLLEIHKKLQECSLAKPYMKRIVALVAMGGMGKTETARTLVDEYRKHYKNVAWVDAETESSTRQSFIKIANFLNIFELAEDVKGKELAQLVYRHTSENVKEPSLFIFDNTNRLKTDTDVFGIYDYLPTQAVENPPLILLTSQTTEWGRHCAVLNVIGMNESESWNFFRSRFKLTGEEIQEDTELRNLLESLIARLNGYPLALGLAAANISFIPGQGSTELLKRKLKKYIDCVDSKTFLKQRVDTQLATEYNRTMTAVWDIAMENLDRQEYAQGAKHLLTILAHCPQANLVRYKLQELYYIKNAYLRITFPDENDGIFEESLDALQTVGIARMEADNDCTPFSKIRIHRLVQQLASLSDNKKIAIQKISWDLFQGTVCGSEVSIYGYVKSTCGQLKLPEGQGQMRRLDDVKWKKQLEIFEDGSDIALVADFILNNRPSHPDSRETPNPDKLWSCIMNAVKVKSSLVGNCKETRNFLELVLLSVVEVENTVDSWCRNAQDESLIEQTALSFRLSIPQPDCMLASFRKWLSEFDFSSANEHNSVEIVLYASMTSLDLFGRFYSLAGKKLQFVSTKAWLQLEIVVNSRHGEDPSRYSHPLFLVYFLESMNLNEPNELLTINRVLDHVSAALEVTYNFTEYKFIAQGVLRKLVVNPNCVQCVIQHARAMNCLKSQNLVVFSDRVDPLDLTRFWGLRPEQ